MTELTALPGEIGALTTGIGGLLAAPMTAGLTGLGLDASVAAPLASFLSPEIIGGGIGELAGGTKGLEEGLLAGATMGGGLGGLTDLIGNTASFLGAPASVSEAIGSVGNPVWGGLSNPVSGSASEALQFASPFIQGAMNAPPSTPTAAPVNTVTPAPAAPALALPGGGGASGLNLEGNTAPQVGPWRSFWGATNSTPMVGTGNSPAAATSQTASATQQQQFVPSP